LPKILITAGPTREYIDSVRFLSNASSGRTGFLIAQEAQHRGAEVVLVTGPTLLPPPPKVRVISVETAEEMAGAVLDHLLWAEVLIGTAAVCDWRPRERAPEKLAKGALRKLDLVPTPDILALAAEKKGNRCHIGFALEDAEDAHKKAREKLQKKKLDYIVLNSPESLGRDSGFYEILGRSGRSWPLGWLDKRRLAAIIVDLALRGEEALEGV